MKGEKCIYKDCERMVYCRKYCKAHYKHLLRDGKVGDLKFYIKNKIQINNDHAEVIMTNRYGEHRGTAKIDIDDIEKISKYQWSVANNRYAITTLKNGYYLLMHRYVMDNNTTDRSIVTDHINHDSFDNRKSNLRICTQSENCKNKNPIPKNAINQYGISISRNRYYSVVLLRKYWGCFTDINSAIEVRDRVLLEYQEKIAKKEYV
jgi:hypothetical protein